MAPFSLQVAAPFPETSLLVASLPLTSRRRYRPRLAFAAAAGIALVTGTGAARAQSATPLERYQPTPIGDALFASPSATVDAHLAFDAGLRFSFADAPLALRARDAAGTYTDLGAIVGRQAVLHAQVSAAIFSRLLLELDLPMTVDQGGDSPVANGVKIASPSGFALNDLRVGARFAALAPRGFLPGVALSLSTWVPTATRRRTRARGARGSSRGS